MNATVALAGGRQRLARAELAGPVLLTVGWLGILRFHPSFLPALASVYWADALILAMGCLWVTYTGGIRWSRLLGSITFLGLLFLILITTAILGSSVFAPGPLPWSANLIQAGRFLVYGLVWLFLADAAVRARVDWERTARILVIGAVAANVGLAMIQLLNPPGIGSAVYALWGEDKLRPFGATTPRVYGTYFNANWFGIFAAWCATYAVAARGSRSGKTHSWWVLASVIFMLLVSGSRTGALTTAFGVVVTFLSLAAGPLPKRIRISPARLFRSILLVLVAIGGLVLALRELPLQSLLRRFMELQALLDAAEGAEVESFSARLRTWQKSYEMFLDSPIFGVGGSTETWGFNAHSGYLVMLMFFGVLGAAALTMFVVGACTLVWQTLANDASERRLRAWFIGFTGSLAMAMLVDEIVFSSQLLFLWFILLALATGQSALRGERLNGVR